MSRFPGGPRPDVEPTVTPKQVVVNTKSASQRKGNLAQAPTVARTEAAQSKAKTSNSPPQNLQNPLTALFGNRMKSRRQK